MLEMNNKEKLDSIKVLIKNSTNISPDTFTKAVKLLCNNILEYDYNAFKHRKTDDYYECYLMDKVLIRWNQNVNHAAALSRLSNDICLEQCNSEWGILLHGDGIWLLNRDIPMGKSSFGGKRTVFKLSFIYKTDIDYLDFFKAEYLLGYNKSIYFFRDLITYKNTFFPSYKCNSWDVYWSCNKRFLAFYILQYKGCYSEDTKTCYKNMTMRAFEEYIRRNGNIRTANTAKNQFFYIKSFILSQAYNEEFDVGSDVILKRCEDILIERDRALKAADIKKIVRIIRHIERQRNGVRNKVIFLILLCFGMERRRICELRWSDIGADCRTIKIGINPNCKHMVMPKILRDSIRELMVMKTNNADYIFGNARTQWLRPLPEGGINGILESIKDIDRNDEFYNNFSPANFRKWLFRFMFLEKKLPLQDILITMNIPICNIGNYISDDEMIAGCTDRIVKRDGYILEDWCERVLEEYEKSK